MTEKEEHFLYENLKSIVGENYVTDEEFVRRGYTRVPALYSPGTRGETPGIVVRPESSKEISEIMKVANEERIPVIPRGGGGTVTVYPPKHVGTEKSILLDTTRMNDVIEIDDETMRVTAECGSVLSTLSERIKKKGLHMYTVDVPFHMDTLGGVLSGFCGGGEPSDLATAGTLNHHVLGLKVVLPQGDIIQTGGGPGTNTSLDKTLHREAGTPDLTGMFIGDGGIFGIKTEATIAVNPFPEAYKIGCYKMGSKEDTWKAFSKLVKTDPYPYSRLIVFDDEWLLFYVISEGFEEIAEFKEKIVKDVCTSLGGKEEKERGYELASLFSVRDFGEDVVSKGSMIYFGENLVPRNRTLDYLDRIHSILDEELQDLEIIEKTGFIVPYLRATTITGILVYFEEKMSELGDRIEEINRERIDPLLREFGGFTEANQGRGAVLSASLWSPTYRKFAKSIKETLDPNNILMPNLWRLDQ